MTVLKEMNSLIDGQDEFVKSLAPRVDVLEQGQIHSQTHTVQGAEITRGTSSALLSRPNILLPCVYLLFELNEIDGIRKNLSFSHFSSEPLILRIDNSVVYPYLLAGRALAIDVRPLF